MTHAAFDSVASDYDRQFTHTAIGQMQRARVHQLSGLTSTHSDTKVLELNCGTGTDAVWMAGLGFQVLATDMAPKMVEITQKKLAAAGFAATSRTAICDINQLAALSVDNFTTFDIVWSDFGGLNCLSANDLSKLNVTLITLLPPKGRFIAVVMGRFCWWESLYFCLKGNRTQAFRRLKKSAISAPAGEQGDFVPTWYYTPTELKQLFSNFTVKRIQPIGFWLPPSYLTPFFQKFPRFLHLLNALEGHCTGHWMAWGADHFLIEFTD